MRTFQDVTAPMTGRSSPRMQIDTLVQDEVVVVTLQGKITLGEGDEMLKETVARLVQQHQSLKAVIDLTNVPYIDSAGLGELVRSYAFVAHNRGRIILCHPSSRLVDLLSITKLRSVYQILPTVHDAVAAFRRADHVNDECLVTCPICDPPQQVAFALGAFFDGQECGVCGNSFRIDRPQTPLVAADAHTRASVRIMGFPTYRQERVALYLGAKSTITVGKQLDLFTFDVIDLAWQLVPAPRRVLIDVAGITEYSDIGLRRLIELSKRTDSASESVLLTRHKHEPTKITLIEEALGQNERAFPSEQAALAALRSNGLPPCLLVDVRRAALA